MEFLEKEKERVKILDCLNVIGFDSEKHTDIKDAMRECVKKDNYVDVLSGRNTDENLLAEVQEVIKSYKYLKEVPSEKVVEVIEEREEKEKD